MSELKVQLNIPEIYEIDILNLLRNFPSQNGISTEYKLFLETLESPVTQDSVLKEWFLILKDNISLLSNKNAACVQSLLKVSWLQRDTVADAYIDLILNLVSAHDQIYTNDVLRTILQKHFISTLTSDYILKLEENEPPKNYLHRLLWNILHLIPVSNRTFLSMAVEYFPHMSKELNSQVNYITNLLCVLSYYPDHQRKILEIVIEKILRIDVNAPKAEIEEAQNSMTEDEDEELFKMEEDSSSLSNSDKGHVLGNTLDHLLLEMFSFIEKYCFINNGELDWEATKKLYKDFLAIFDKLILPTYACSHIQFLWFYMCSLKVQLADGFLDYLWKKVQNPNVPPVLRQTAAFYIGSLLSRANFISTRTVKDSLSILCNWIYGYINAQSGSSTTYADISIHGTFYAVCQSVFYVFAFRHKELVEMKGGIKYLKELGMERMVTCRLNPLKMCAPAIVKNFANVTRNYQLAYCYTVIEKNNRSQLPLVGSSAMFSSGTLDTFFPFDPYILQKSVKWIEPLYRIYQENNEEIINNSQDDVDDFLPDEASPMQFTPSCIPDFLCYGTSPGFKQGNNL